MERSLTATWRTRLLPLGFAALLAGNALAQQPGNPPAWSVLNLGKPDGVQGTFTTFSAFNNHGQVVGSTADLERGGRRGFLYDAGRMTAIPALPGLRFNEGLGINDRGQVIGSASDVGVERGFIYSGGQLTPLVLPGSIPTRPVGINERGDVLLEGRTPAAFGLNYSGHVYSNGTLGNIGTLGGSSTFPRFINDRGQVAGTSRLTGDSTAEQGFFYSEGRMSALATSGTAVPSALNNVGQVAGSYNRSAAIFHEGRINSLGNLGGLDSDLSDINDAGNAVGTIGYGPLGSQYPVSHAFLFSDGQVQDLHASFSFEGLPIFSSGAFDLNERGQVLAAASFSVTTPDGGTAFTGPRYFLWEDGHATDLSALLPPGTVLDAALNDVGQVVFNFSDGTMTTPYLLTPIPEPSTYALMLAGLATLACIARRRASAKTAAAS